MIADAEMAGWPLGAVDVQMHADPSGFHFDVGSGLLMLGKAGRALLDP